MFCKKKDCENGEKARQMKSILCWHVKVEPETENEENGNNDDKCQTQQNREKKYYKKGIMKCQSNLSE